MKTFDLNDYLDIILTECRSAFGERFIYMGFMGSYFRGEATENSDIDVLLVLDCFTIGDMDIYRSILERAGHYDKSCGFICGKDELSHWTPLESCQFIHTTKDIFGKLADLVPEYTREDEINYVKFSLGNLYHELCHRYIHSDREKSVNKFRGTCKYLFFLIQNMYYLEHGKFIITKRELKERVCEEDRNMLEMVLLPDDYDFDSAFSSVFKWCQNAFERIDIMQ